MGFVSQYSHVELVVANPERLLAHHFSRRLDEVFFGCEYDLCAQRATSKLNRVLLALDLNLFEAESLRSQHLLQSLLFSAQR